MSNDNLNHMVPVLTKILVNTCLQYLGSHEEMMSKEGVEASSLLNMLMGSFLGFSITILNGVKSATEGEESLVNNIELAKKSIIKSITDLPFIDEIKVTNI